MRPSRNAALPTGARIGPRRRLGFPSGRAPSPSGCESPPAWNAVEPSRPWERIVRGAERSSGGLERGVETPVQRSRGPLTRAAGHSRKCGGQTRRTGGQRPRTAGRCPRFGGRSESSGGRRAHGFGEARSPVIISTAGRKPRKASVDSPVRLRISSLSRETQIAGFSARPFLYGIGRGGWRGLVHAF